MFPVELHLALPAQDRRKYFEKSGFTRAVGTEDAEHFAIGHGERYGVEDGTGSISEGQIAGMNRGIHRASFLRPARWSRKRKNGPPKNAVMMPTGNSAGASRTR